MLVSNIIQQTAKEHLFVHLSIIIELHCTVCFETTDIYMYFMEVVCSKDLTGSHYKLSEFHHFLAI